ncbi:hypothetical protein JCM3766R1_006176 [Sporobolomyces carnicolor]
MSISRVGDSASDTRTAPTRTFNRQDADAVYSLAEQTTPLGAKVRHALEVVEQAIELYSIRNLALSFNGGKDCTVLIHLLAASLLRVSAVTSASLPPIPTIYVRQPSPFPQEEKFTAVCADRYHLELEAVQGESMKDSLRVWIENRESRLGCDEGQVKAVLVGTRRTDPHGAKLTSFDPTDPTWPRFMRVHPILDWSYHDVWDFLRHPDLTLGGPGTTIEWCELYDYGYTSIGSTHNTFPNPCLRRTPSTTPFSSTPSRPSSPDPSTTSTPPRSAAASTTTITLSDSIGSWLPAWELADETQERAGREVSLKQVETKVEELRQGQVANGRDKQADRDDGARRTSMNGNGHKDP